MMFTKVDKNRYQCSRCLQVFPLTDKEASGNVHHVCVGGAGGAVGAVKVMGGAGTELKALLSNLGIDAVDSCPCNRHAKEMDNKGVEWCQRNIETVLEWIEKESRRRGIPFVKKAAKMVVRIAIRRARKKEEKAQRDHERASNH